MQVKFWEPGKTYLKYKKEIDSAIHRVLTNGQLCLGFGPDIEEFEEVFAEYIGVKYAVMCGGGTHALLLAYKAAGIGPGDEVITTSHTFIATIDQIKVCGATPVLVDVGEDGLIDPILIEKAITPHTKAIVPVHLEGKVCDMGAILNIARKYNLTIIEDSAQAVGAKWKHRYVGAIGDMGCFSFYPAKILGSVGNAGMVTTDDKKLAQKLKMLRCNYNIGKNPDYEVDWGFQLEPDNLQAAVLKAKFIYLEDYLKRRAEIAVKYDEAFKDLPITLSLQQKGRVYQDYVIRVTERDKLAEYLKLAGIGILGHNLIPNHEYSILAEYSLPKTTEYIYSQIRIPCNPNLTDKEVGYVIKIIKQFYGE